MIEFVISVSESIPEQLGFSEEKVKQEQARRIPLMN